jgi:hypothetical protein
MSTPLSAPRPYIGTGTIVEFDSVRYVVLKPNSVNLRVERESDGVQFNLPRAAAFTIVGQKQFSEMVQAPDFEQYNVVKYVGPKFENKLMAVVKVDVFGKRVTLADLDQPRNRLNNVPFSNVVKVNVAEV